MALALTVRQIVCGACNMADTLLIRIHTHILPSECPVSNTLYILTHNLWQQDVSQAVQHVCKL